MYMKAIQLLIDEALVAEVDKEAKRLGSDRSKLMRMALRDFLAIQRVREREEAHRRGYLKSPASETEMKAWRRAELWPED